MTLLVRSRTMLALSALTLMLPAVRGQGPALAWRTDYNAARREATEKKRPVLLDFVTENCFWCKKLDSTTLRDPTVIALLNDQFVPIRIDAEREPTLAQRLQISSYPTMLLAAPDGRIITIVEGYLEANKLLAQLNATIAATSPTPEWMTRDLQEAT